MVRMAAPRIVPRPADLIVFVFPMYPLDDRWGTNTYGRCIFHFHGVTDAAQPETAHTGLVAFQPTAAAFNLGYFDLVSHR